MPWAAEASLEADQCGLEIWNHSNWMEQSGDHLHPKREELDP